MSENNINEECIIEIDDLVNSMVMEQQGQTYMSETQSPVIHKIRRHIYQKDENAFKPSIISIGPYHHGSQAVCVMQMMKWEYLKFLLDLNPEKMLSDHIEAVSGIEAQARSCYADKIKMDKDSFVKMLLLDGCFLLLTFHRFDEILQDKPEIAIEEMQLGVSQENMEHGGDVEYGRYGFDNNKHIHFKLIPHDILQLENQIPFFVVAKIYETVTGDRKQASILVNDVVQCMKESFDFFPKVTKEFNPSNQLHHLLQLFHLHFKPCQRDMDSCTKSVRPRSFHQKSLRSISNFLKKNNYLHYQNNQDLPVRATHWRRATEYHKAGIELQKREFNNEDSNSLLCIRFCNGTLEVPCLTFDQEIAGLFQNLIAFEKACPRYGNYITVYAVFWSQFGGTPDDVALLTEKGIIVHHVTSDTEIANLIRGLGEYADFDLDGDHYLKPLYHMVELQYQNRWFLLQKFLGTITSKIHNWSRQTKMDLPTTVLPL